MPLRLAGPARASAAKRPPRDADHRWLIYPGDILFPIDMDLSPTAYVILGFLSWGPMSGYDIKALVDESTRFFWAASYGQIYPELRRLAEAGLIEGAERPQGGRQRTVYTLTAEGSACCSEWLADEPEAFELRDEGLLKLFFASAAPDRRHGDRGQAPQAPRDAGAVPRGSRRPGKPQGYAL